MQSTKPFQQRLKFLNIYSFFPALSYWEKLFWSFWWIIAFSLICFFFYEWGVRRIEKETNILENRLHELEREKNSILFLQKQLNQQINSQSDPYWIEFTLMKGLGLVPEGQTKVYFEEH